MSHDKKKIIAVVIFVCILLVPTVLWALRIPLADRFGDVPEIMSSLGKLTGIWGLILFAMTLVLATRIPLLDRWFRGLSEVYQYHHHLGAVSFLLILAHPLLLAVKYLAVSVPLTALFLLPGDGIAKDLGIYALWGMIAVMVVTLFARILYQFKLATHKMFGVVFILASVHTLMIPSDVSLYLPLKVYMMGIVVAGVGAYLYRLAVDYLPIQKYMYRVTSVETRNNVVQISMSPIARKMQYVSGQFVFIYFESDSISREAHPFSLSSGGGDEISITVKNLGDYTKTLGNLKEGDIAHIEGPFGVFNFLQGSHKKQVWIAGGVGVTPFLGMARSFNQMQDEYVIDLYYCVRTKNDLVYGEELERVAQNVKGFRVIPYISEEKNEILTAEKIRAMSGSLEDKDFFLCGPLSMVESLQEQLRAYNIYKGHIHVEKFSML